MTTVKADPPPIDRPVPSSALRAKNPRLALVIAAFAAVYLIWGSTYLGIKLAIASFPPLLMSGARFLIAGCVLYAVMRRIGAPRPTGVFWRNAAIVGALLLLVGNGGVSWAEQTVPTSTTALIIAATPLWMILVDWLRPNGTRPRWPVFAGLTLGFAGVALIVGSRDPFGRNVIDPAGSFVLLLASLCWAFGSVFSRHARQSPSALLAVAMQMISGGLLLFFAGLAGGELRQLSLDEVTRTSLFAFVYLTILGSLVGFTAYVWLLQVSTPARVATYAYVNPFIAVILGWVILGEALPESVLFAAALILFAVVLITTFSRSLRTPR